MWYLSPFSLVVVLIIFYDIYLSTSTDANKDEVYFISRNVKNPSNLR